jgi:hypothetical protein
VTRTRTRASLNSEGTYTKLFFGTTTTSLGHVNDVSRCEDDVGINSDHPLNIVHQRWNIVPLEGTDNSQLPYRSDSFANYPPEFYQLAVLSHLDTGFSPLDPVTKVLARTNPSRPIFNLPAFIGEMKDLPALFKGLGHNLLDKGANAYLSYQFGWRPLINDIGTALDFSKQVDARIGELKRMFSDKGLKRRIKLGEATVSQDELDVVVQSDGALVRCKHTARTQKRMWGTVRWKPADGAYPPSTDLGSYTVAKALLGAGVSGFTQAAWQLMPWSWMVDWFGNVDEYLQASDNTIPATHSDVNIMTNIVSTHKFTVKDKPSWLTGGDASGTLETKSRFQGSSPSLAAKVPLLSGSQISILGALAVQRLPPHVKREAIAIGRRAFR